MNKPITLSGQVGAIKKAVARPKFEVRVPKPGGELTSALDTFAEIVRSIDFPIDGRMSMTDLRRIIGFQIATAIDTIPTSDRVKEIFHVEVPFGISTVTNLVEVTPRVVALRESPIDPKEIVEGESLQRAAVQIGSCPGQIAPTIRRNLTIYRDAQGVDWVRASGMGNEKHDKYTARNLEMDSDAKCPGFHMTEAAYERTLADARKHEGVAYGGCPALQYLMKAGYKNLLAALVMKVREVCIAHFDFELTPDHLVHRDETEQEVFPEPDTADSRDLYS